MIYTLQYLTGGFIAITLLWLVRIIVSSVYLKRERNYSQQTTSPQRPHIYILLPVLNEDVRLREFARYFTDCIQPTYAQLTLIVITTEKEATERQGRSTKDVAQVLSDAHEDIIHIHYPFRTGVMAHQLNYALSRIPDDAIVAVYNADSVPEAETFAWVANNYSNASCQIFQQYGVYSKNANFLLTRPGSSILLANAYWQSRWSLGFEYYRAKTAYAKRLHGWPAIIQPFNYCIGHGLFISAKFIKEVRFSEDTTNEDAVLGVRAADFNIPIIPIPFFDLAESPDSRLSIYIQKSNWIQGPLQSFVYLHNLVGDARHKFIMTINVIKLFAHALYWVFGPLSLITQLCLTLVATLMLSPAYAWCAAAPLGFLIFPSLAANYSIDILTNTRKLATLNLILRLVVGALPAYIIHGAAGIRGVILSKRIFRGNKQKTLMAQYGSE